MFCCGCWWAGFIFDCVVAVGFDVSGTIVKKNYGFVVCGAEGLSGRGYGFWRGIICCVMRRLMPGKWRRRRRLLMEDCAFRAFV